VVYGFERQNAALFLEVDSLISSNITKENIFLQFPNISLDILERIYTLATCDPNQKKESYTQKLDIKKYTKDDCKRISYVAQGTTFFLNYKDESLYKLIHPVLSHMCSEDYTTHKISVDFIYHKKDYWVIHFNNTEVCEPTHISKIMLVLQDIMLIALYQSKKHLISIHAATLEYHKNVFLFPAISGSGKTTLAAALMKSNFTLYSDELAIIDLKGNILPLPFPLSIKEGSWKILKDSYPILSKTDYHIRFDNQKVKYLPPEHKAASFNKPTHIIFPKYTKNVATKLTTLSVCEAMYQIKEAGYELNEPLNIENFEKILDYLMLLPAYQLEYSSLDEAITLIKSFSNE